MIWIYLLLLFVLTITGSMVPMMFKKYSSSWMTLMLAFSGAFLLAITFLHLMPEVFHDLGEKAGLFILIGFLLQLVLQRLSHGIEHGHVHDHDMSVHAVTPIFTGLLIHAFMEGIPLGFSYQSHGTTPSIFLAIAAHKIPEAITLSALLLAADVKKNRWLLIILFALASPVSGILAMYFGQKFYFVSNQLVYIIPIVAGAFLHISTTILYESGTKHHQLSRQKVMAVMLGLAFALATLLLHIHS
ncbi:MAG: ZIP family metal transporter [Chitinophagaceae bacterium]|nr:ZIP family metal transporter [Chitinophagaceae bacterium]